jgi:putative transposase
LAPKHWERVIPFFAFPQAVRRIIYTRRTPSKRSTQNYAALYAREVIFRFDDAATKLLFLVLREAAREWKLPPREWFEAKTQFAIMFDERFVQT